MQPGEEELKELLLEIGLLTRAEFELIEREKPNELSLEEALAVRKIVLDDDLARIKARLFGIPFIRLEPALLSFETLCLIPEPIARKAGAVAVGKKDNKIEVALYDVRALDQLRSFAEERAISILPRLASRNDIYAALRRYQILVRDFLGQGFAENIKEIEQGHSASSAGAKTNLLEGMIKHAVISHAQEFYLEPFEESFVVRERCHGSLVEAMVLPRRVGKELSAELCRMAGIAEPDDNAPRQGEITLSIGNQKIVLAVSALKTYFGSRVAVRIASPGQFDLSFDALGLRPAEAERIYQKLDLPGKIIVIASDRRGGRTTLFQHLLSRIASRHQSVCTVEQSVEKIIPFVSHLQSTPKNFLPSLRATLLQDPDVLGIDSVEDAVAWKLVLEAARRGTRVIVCIPAGSASAALEQLLNWSDRADLAAHCSCIIARQVVPLYQNAAKLEKVSRQQLVSLGKLANLQRVVDLANQNHARSVTSPAELAFLRSKALSSSVGMIGLNEIVDVTPRIARLIEQGREVKEIEESARTEGTNSLIEDGLAKSAAGIVSLDAVIALAEKK